MAATRIRVKGDTFILCTFSFRYGPCVLTSGNTAEEVMAEIPEWLNSEDNLSFCRVGHWSADKCNDDWRPHDLKTIFQITPYEVDALDEED